MNPVFARAKLHFTIPVTGSLRLMQDILFVACPRHLLIHPCI
jgi:hypothetical protein